MFRPTDPQLSLLESRWGVFTETVTHFLRKLRKEASEKLAKVDDGYVKRYLDRAGYFADANREQAQRRMPVVAQDLYALVRAFASDATVKELGLLRAAGPGPGRPVRRGSRPA